MAKSVALPFIVPNFATLQSTGAAEFAMIGHPTAYNQTLNQATNICCGRKFLGGFTSPQVSIPNISIDAYKFIEKYSVNFRFIYDCCLEIIKAMLEERMYILYDGVDDFYLPGKSWYGTRHMHHTGIICGYSSEKKLGKYFVFEINMYERKMIQDTTVESAYPNENNAFGSTAFLGTTSEFGEQWLYSRIDYMCVNDIAGCRIKSAIAYIPKLGKNAFDIEAYKVSERFCSFGSTWDNKKSESNYVSCSNATDKYVIVDITNALIHEKSKQLIATNGLIFKSKKKNLGFSAISTGDSCFMPQIIEINYF